MDLYADISVLDNDSSFLFERNFWKLKIFRVEFTLVVK